MKFKDKLLVWILVIVALSLFLYMVKGILLPFVVAMIASYFLDPAADKLEALGASRPVATITITMLFFVVFSVLLVLLAPLFYDQFVAMMNKMPEYINAASDKLWPSVIAALQALDPDALEKAQSSISDISGYIFEFVAKIVSNIWSSGVAVVNLLSLIFITPVVTFYMLRDWDKMVAKIDSYLPSKYAGTIREQAKQIDRTLAGYIRGQTNVCLLLGTFYAVGLTAAGLDFGFFIGMATGILSFIPYVGLLFGFVVGITIAFFQFSDIAQIGVVAGIFIFGQLVEGNFVSPKLVGDKVGLHPVWIIFGLLAGGAMFGFIGILVAVPVTAVIGVLVRFVLGRYVSPPKKISRV